MLVTLQQAREHIRATETNADDADLQVKIDAASAAVLDYVGDLVPRDSQGDPITDSQGLILDVRGRDLSRMKLATLVTVAYYYRERDGSQEHAVPAQFGYGYSLPQGATALLYSLRKPTVI